MHAVSVRGERFVDSFGREVILHGMGLVCKDKSRNYIGDWNESDFMKMQQWGCNVIRLGIIWDGLEPEPGVYDDAYLDQMEAWVRLAEQYGMHVFLDMHQDLYSYRYADGAPEWATITDDLPHVNDGIWSDAYLFSPAVQRAFDRFWENAPAPDGIGLQDHYAAAWRHVARKFGHNPCVIGYDLMNEPFIGSQVNDIQPLMFHQYGIETAQITGQSSWNEEELPAVWMDPVKRMEALRLMEDPELFRRVIDVTEQGYKQFEQTKLMAFYRKTAAAIREADPTGLLFLETSYFCNLGVRSGIEPIVRDDGLRDPYQVYAPHGYDLVTDTDFVHTPSSSRVQVIFDRHEETRSRLRMPMLVGEWGAYGDSEHAGEAALAIKKIFERSLCSDTYWCYTHPDIDQYSSFKGVQRGYPAAVAGELLRYAYDAGTGRFELEWVERASDGESTVIYLPKLAGKRVLLSAGEHFDTVQIGGGESGYLHIHPHMPGERRKLVVE
ncbi:cellulase family glycosylhydrolase [Paenibacillus mendelii]|uniref:Cellulase family glycosylhydrolase n=1 Tax=Paenibacillus mendelii TaxID=206163 RepID=A0ABV6J6P4_9BACL|nr:cellulase family glycosylhydrolase [Paenibacillus mendelii]MCQ6561957.1 cellulase family glycosylhydrolase [Paenibacillus mendelii]